MSIIEGPLGRIAPPDFDHVESYPLSALPQGQQPLYAPVVLGVNWYEAFDRPVKDKRGRQWIGLEDLGRIRGGHAVCLLPAKTQDPYDWWDFYDQGSEGACVGFASSRCMSLLNRRRYDARWLYREAQQVDEWPGEDYDGTSVRAAMDVLRKQGHREVRAGETGAVDHAAGILENRWARSADEVLAALGTPHLDYVTILNSWGRYGYPHFTRMSAGVLQRLLDEDGEAAIVTDRP